MFENTTKWSLDDVNVDIFRWNIGKLRSLDYVFCNSAYNVSTLSSWNVEKFDL